MSCTRHGSNLFTFVFDGLRDNVVQEIGVWDILRILQKIVKSNGFQILIRLSLVHFRPNKARFEIFFRRPQELILASNIYH